MNGVEYGILGTVLVSMTTIMTVMARTLYNLTKGRGRSNGNGNGTARRRIDELEEKVWRSELSAVENRMTQLLEQVRSDLTAQHATLDAMVTQVATMQGAFDTFKDLADTWRASCPTPPPTPAVAPPFATDDTHQP